MTNKEGLRNARVIVAELTHISKKEWRLKVPLNVSLFKGYNLAGEHMLHFDSITELLSHRTADEI